MNRDNMTAEKLAAYFDHTQLRAYATDSDFRKLCDEARRYQFAMVAINPAPVALCKELLAGCGVHVGAAISFPLGQLTIAEKVNETRAALEDGADEIDYVVNITQLKERRLAYVEDEMRAIVDVCKERGAISKVIFETCYLTDDEKKILCDIALKTRIDFVKTSTGFGTAGATVEDVRLMKAAVGDAVKVKAAGGIRTLQDALAMLGAGAERIGASASVEIVEALRRG
jgi:deoxyribose-phosphate aldolase